MIDVAKLFFPTLSLVFDFAYGLLSLKYIKIFYGQVYLLKIASGFWILNYEVFTLLLLFSC